MKRRSATQSTGSFVSPKSPNAKISRTAADGSDLGTWSFVQERDHFACINAAGDRFEVKVHTLVDALAATHEALRASHQTVLTIDYLDADLHPADVADLVTAATPDLPEIAWQERTDEWDDELYDLQVDTEHLTGSSEVIEGDLPVVINGSRCFPVSIDNQLRLVPFDIDYTFDEIEPHSLVRLAELSASNEWGTYSATLSIIPRGYSCRYELVDGEGDITFSRLHNSSPGRLYELALSWMRGILGAYSFHQHPTVVATDGGVELTWPDGYDPADYGEDAAVSINPHPTS